ncbi:hypothetical protein Droror1_Dr00019628 [Drosera rotundifolia]
MTTADSHPAATSAPTGCYKCGRPGHWSRDCPSSTTTTNPNPNPNWTSNPNSASIRGKLGNEVGSGYNRSGLGVKASAGSGQKPKKVVKRRPKLVPEVLVSNDGIGYVLRYFPRNFKYHGRGHEVSDLKNLLHMYKEWHAQLLPYYSFDQFVHKVEQVGSSKLVRSCLRGLREKVASGGDPAKWNEPSVDEAPQNLEDPLDSEEPKQHQDKSSPDGHIPEEMQEDILNEIYHQTVDYTPQNAPNTTSPVPHNSRGDIPADAPDNGDASRATIQINEEQKARMEANRLKALGRASAKARILSTS